MGYELVYDLATTPLARWPFGAVSVLFAVLLVLVFRRRRALRAETPAGGFPQDAFWLVFFAFGSLLCALFFVGAWIDRREVLAEVAQGRGAVVEGPIAQLGVSGRPRRRLVAFRVAGQDIHFYENDTNTYTVVPDANGLLVEGLPVRITHLRGRIVRLEARTRH